jgi:hypothetical protein
MQSNHYYSLKLKRYYSLIVLILCVCGSTQIVWGQSQRTINTLSSKAESLVNQERIVEAIVVYEGFINQYKGVGKIHLRLGQLYLKRVDYSADALKQKQFKVLASYHFIQCLKDDRVSLLIRKRVCQRKIEQLTAPIQLKGTYHSLQIVTPRAFRGDVKDKDLLPRGPIDLILVRQVNTSPETIRIELPMQVPLDLSVSTLLPARPKFQHQSFENLKRASTQDGMTSNQKPSNPLFIDTNMTKKKNSISKVPGIVIGTVGLVTLGISSYFYAVRSSDQLEFQRNYPNHLPTFLVIPGAILTGIGTGWLIWTW